MPATPNPREWSLAREASPAITSEPATNVVASVARIFSSVPPKSPLSTAPIAISAASETRAAAPRRKMRRSDTALALRLGLDLLAPVLRDEGLGGLVRLVVDDLL